MKNLKHWLLALMAVFMLVGVATGCTNDDGTEEPETEQNQDTETEDSSTEESTEEEQAE